MDKKVIALFLVGLWPLLVYTQAESGAATEHRVEHVSVPSQLPQVLFEMKLMKYELMSLGTTINGLQNKLDNVVERLDTLEAKSTDNVVDKQSATGKDDFQELKEEMLLFRKGFSREKQSVQKIVEQITQDMNTAMTVLVLNVNQTITDKQDQLDYKFGKITADIDKRLKETKNDISVKEKENDKTIRQLSVQKETDKILINSKLEMLKNENLMINSSYNELLAKLERQKVAFSVRLSKTTPKLPAGSTIKFDEVVYQTGGGYSPEDGVFTCPESGVYLFNFAIKVLSASATQPKTLVASLVVDSSVIFSVVSESYHQYQDVQASNMVILSLDKGQKVWVRTSTARIEQSKAYKQFSTLGGALLYN